MPPTREGVISEQANVEIARWIYAAFGQGDIPELLGLLEDDVVWVVPGAPEIPYAGTYNGREIDAHQFH